MRTKFIEAVSAGNWGKFAVNQFTEEEWAIRSRHPEAHGQLLLRGRGWDRAHVFVIDIQTGEGAMFFPGGYAPADLNKHRIWVCPLFEPFLVWLYLHQQTSETFISGWLDSLPDLVELDAPAQMHGYRRLGAQTDDAVAQPPEI